jgi:hypothetical protein
MGEDGWIGFVQIGETKGRSMYYTVASVVFGKFYGGF